MCRVNISHFHFQSAHDIVAAALSGGSLATGSSPGLANLPNTSVDGHEESPEKLSLKARLKLFEKEIEQQGAAPGNCENNSRPLLILLFVCLSIRALARP